MECTQDGARSMPNDHGHSRLFAIRPRKFAPPGCEAGCDTPAPVRHLCVRRSSRPRLAFAVRVRPRSTRLAQITFETDLREMDLLHLVERDRPLSGPRHPEGNQVLRRRAPSGLAPNRRVEAGDRAGECLMSEAVGSASDWRSGSPEGEVGCCRFGAPCHPPPGTAPFTRLGVVCCRFGQ